jgi:hypothetical protein
MHLDVFIHNFPFQLESQMTYRISLPRTYEVENFTCTCGDLTQLEPNVFILSTGDVSSTCRILGDGVPLELSSISIFNTDPVQIQKIEEVYRVGDQFEVVAPSQYDHIWYVSDALQLYYIVDPPLPAGLSLASTTGRISGTLLAASLRATYSVSLFDPLNLESKVVLVIENLEVLPPVSAASVLSPAAYSVPVGFFLLCVLVLYLYIRNDTKKEYHIFISYRGE